MTLMEYHRRKLAALQQIYALALNAREQCEAGSPEDRGYTLALDALSVLNRAVASLLADIVRQGSGDEAPELTCGGGVE